MKNHQKRKALILLVAGTLIITTGQLLNHYIGLPDFINGSLIGIGIGILLIALRPQRPKAAGI